LSGGTVADEQRSRAVRRRVDAVAIDAVRFHVGRRQNVQVILPNATLTGLVIAGTRDSKRKPARPESLVNTETLPDPKLTTASRSWF
jgi:hypothetical protein